MSEIAKEIHVAVVGGGIAGLTSALRLSESGFKVTLFEEKHYLGGMLGANHGHAILRHEGEHADEICKELNNGLMPGKVRDGLKDNARPIPDPAVVKSVRENLAWRLSGEQEEVDSTYVILKPARYEAIEKACKAWPAKGRKAEKVESVEKLLNCVHVYNATHYEHCFHMYLNWYNNFWEIIESDLGLKREALFSPRTNIKSLARGAFPHTTQLTNVGASNTILQNLLSNFASPWELYLAGYALMDLMATPFDRSEFLSKYSVNGFMHGRWYATNKSSELVQTTLAKAFAAPSYLTAAATYKNFVKFGAADPVPTLWVMNGNTAEHLIAPIEAKLIERGCTIMTGARVEKVLMRDDGSVEKIRWTYSDYEAKYPLSDHPRPMWDMPVDFAVLAVPRVPMTRLIEEATHETDLDETNKREKEEHRIIKFVPELARIRHLRDEPMASLDLYFTKKLPDIPPENVILTDCEMELTFIDNSQAWTLDPEVGKVTALNVVASNFHSLPDYYVWDRIQRRKIAFDIIKELNRYVTCFDAGNEWGKSGDIDWNLTKLNLNVDQQLLLNEVGSDNNRPQHSYPALPNLFFAGDMVRNTIDVVTIEGAVVTGLAAANAVVAKAKLGDPVNIIEPKRLADTTLQAYRVLGLPGVAFARWLSAANELMAVNDEDRSMEDKVRSQMELVYAPYKLAADMWTEAWTAYVDYFTPRKP